MIWDAALPQPCSTAELKRSSRPSWQAQQVGHMLPQQTLVRAASRQAAHLNVRP